MSTGSVTRWVVVILLPPSPVDVALRGYRETYDPLVGHIAPHVTLVHPLVDDIGASELQDLVAQAACRTEPFRLTLREVTPFPDGYIYLNVKEGNDAIIALRDRLYDGRLARHKSRLNTFVPHVTIGQASDTPSMERALADAAALGFDVTVRASEITAYCFDDEERRHAQLTVPLGTR